MTAYSTTDARNAFSDIINRAAYGKERVTLTRRGKTIAAVVPIEDYEILKRIEEEEDREDLAVAKKALAKFKKTGKARLFSEVKKELGL
jgi:prevent-host-death family protein